MRLVGLVATALVVYCVLLPLSLVGVLAILVLGIIAAFGLAYGVFSLVGWQLLKEPAALNGVMFGFFYGGGAFVLLVLFWDRVFALLAWVPGGRDAKFLE